MDMKDPANTTGSADLAADLHEEWVHLRPRT